MERWERAAEAGEVVDHATFRKGEQRGIGGGAAECADDIVEQLTARFDLGRVIVKAVAAAGDRKGVRLHVELVGAMTGPAEAGQEQSQTEQCRREAAPVMTGNPLGDFRTDHGGHHQRGEGSLKESELKNAAVQDHTRQHGEGGEREQKAPVAVRGR